MTRNHARATAALAATLLGGGLTAASAQTITVTAPTPTLAGSSYSYIYTVSSSINLNQLIFNFSDPNVTFAAANGPLTLTSSVPTGGVFIFSSGMLTAGSTEAFSFGSPDAPGGTLGATGVSYNGSGVASVNGVTPAPAPEPSQTAALGLGVLGLAGMAFTARRRSLRA